MLKRSAKYLMNDRWHYIQRIDIHSSVINNPIKTSHMIRSVKFNISENDWKLCAGRSVQSFRVAM